MSAIKNELINYINDIPDEKLLAIKPILHMMSNEIVYIEKIDFDSLDEEEKKEIEISLNEFKNGETINFKDVDWS